ncbi:MAG: hypothetical protein J6L83_09935, partial [Clostridia bacterium]|nr:hypothetical protein [Clostridia bacterium]
RLPPLTLTLAGEFAIFAVFSARANLSLSLHGFEAAFTDVKIAGIRLIDYLGGSVYWYPDLSIACRIDVNIFDVIVGGGGITARKDFFEAYVYAGIQIPDDIWLIGGLEIGSASLGLSTEKIWGKVKVIGIGVGITYYWGGDVDVDLLNAARRDGRSIVPIGTDEDGNTLYMEMTNNVRVLYSTRNKRPGVSALSSSGGITSSTDKRSHTFRLTTSAAEDGLITLTYKAENALEAQDLKDTVSVTIDGEAYKLRWLDTGAAADDSVNAYANAMVKYDESAGEATVSISLTDPESQIGEEIKITTGVASDVSVYGIEKYGDLDSAVLDTNTLTVFGSGIKDFSSVNVYARDDEDNLYQIGTGIPANAVTDSEGADSLVIPITYPENLPSGRYTVEAVGCLKNASGNEVANPVVKVEGHISYENRLQPKALKSASVSLGGNYTISLDVIPDAADFDGYMVDIFEVTDEGYKATSFNNVQMPLKEGETAEAGKSATLTVGGRLLNTDENGEQFYTGLEEGRKYKISVSTYKQTESGAIIESEATVTEEIVMVKPVKTEPKLSIEGSRMIAAGITGMSIETINTSSVTVKVAEVGKLRSGYYTVNEGERVDWKGGDIALGEIDDGMYTVTLVGVNETGDAFSTIYQFSKDTEAPSLLITSPKGGGFFDSDSVTVTGTAEAGANVTATVGETSVSATAARDGSFSVTVPLDVTSAYQDVRLTAEDTAGNVSDEYGFTLTNMLLGDNSLELVILLEGEEVTHVAAGGGAKQFKLAFKSGANYISINENSVAAARISWRSTFISGSGSISSDGSFEGEEGTVGLITASLDNYSATVEVIPTSILELDAEVIIPEGGYVYDGTPKEPEVKLAEDSGLVLGTDYSISYLDNVNAGIATVVITALDTGKCSGSKMLTFEIAAADIDGAEILLVGEGASPAVTVRVGDKELLLDTDYTLSIESNADADEGFVTVTGIGNYTGTKTRSYSLSKVYEEESGGDTDTETETDSETEIESGGTNGTETETGDGQGTGALADNWFAKNAVWIIIVAVVAIGGIVAAVYFLIIKKKPPTNKDPEDSADDVVSDESESKETDTSTEEEKKEDTPKDEDPTNETEQGGS